MPLMWCTRKMSIAESLVQHFCRKKEIPADASSCPFHQWPVLHFRPPLPVLNSKWVSAYVGTGAAVCRGQLSQCCGHVCRSGLSTHISPSVAGMGFFTCAQILWTKLEYKTIVQKRNATNDFTVLKYFAFYAPKQHLSADGKIAHSEFRYKN